MRRLPPRFHYQCPELGRHGLHGRSHRALEPRRDHGRLPDPLRAVHAQSVQEQPSLFKVSERMWGRRRQYQFAARVAVVVSQCDAQEDRRRCERS